MASHTRAGVHGMSMCVRPKGASASTTALTTAGGEPTVADWAGWADTIEHEIVTGIGSRVERRTRAVPHLRSLS